MNPMPPMSAAKLYTSAHPSDSWRQLLSQPLVEVLLHLVATVSLPNKGHRALDTFEAGFGVDGGSACHIEVLNDSRGFILLAQLHTGPGHTHVVHDGEANERGGTAPGVPVGSRLAVFDEERQSGENTEGTEELLVSFADDPVGDLLILLGRQGLTSLLHNFVQDGGLGGFEENLREPEFVIFLGDVPGHENGLGKTGGVKIPDERVFDRGVEAIIQSVIGDTGGVTEFQHSECLNDTSAPQLFLNVGTIPLHWTFHSVGVDASHKVRFSRLEIFHQVCDTFVEDAGHT